MSDLIERLRLGPPYDVEAGIGLLDEAADAIAANDIYIEELRAALESCVRALTASTIGTVNMDDPDWYQQVDLTVAAATRSLGKGVETT